MVSGNIARDSILREEFFGGSGAAIAISSRKLGIKVGLLSVLGRDNFSERYKNFLTSLDIDISLVTQPLHELPTYYVYDNKDTLTSWEWRDNGREQALNSFDLDSERIFQYRLVHLVGTPPALARKLARTNGVMISYEPGPTILHVGEYADEEVIARSYFLFGNEDEFAAMIKKFNFSKPEDFFSLGPKTLIMTKGSKGSEVWYKDGNHVRQKNIKAFRAPKIEDQTGAGDAYKAAFLSGYLRGYDLETCARFGSVLGALVVTQKGVIIEDNNINRFISQTNFR